MATSTTVAQCEFCNNAADGGCTNAADSQDRPSNIDPNDVTQCI